MDIEDKNIGQHITHLMQMSQRRFRDWTPRSLNMHSEFKSYNHLGVICSVKPGVQQAYIVNLYSAMTLLFNSYSRMVGL